MDDPLAEKARRQRLVEESDHAIAADLFAGGPSGDSKAAGSSDSLSPEDAMVQGISKLEISGTSGVEIFGTSVGKVFTTRNNAVEYAMMIKALIRASEASTLTAKDYVEFATLCNVIKTKVEAATNLKSKKGKKKVGKSVKMDTDESWIDNGGVYDDDVGNEFDDFM